MIFSTRSSFIGIWTIDLSKIIIGPPSCIVVLSIYGYLLSFLLSPLACATIEVSPSSESKAKNQSEVYMDSKQWLQIHGLKKLKLTLHTFLKQSVFSHCEGVLGSPDVSFFIYVYCS